MAGFSNAKTESKATNQQVSVQGGGSGSGTLALGSGSSVGGNVTIASLDPEVVNDAFQFTSEANTESNQILGQSNATIQSIAGTLASLTANATPQTDAAQSEILAGGSPTSPVSISNRTVVIVITSAVAVGAVIFFVTRNKK